MDVRESALKASHRTLFHSGCRAYRVSDPEVYTFRLFCPNFQVERRTAVHYFAGPFEHNPGMHTGAISRVDGLGIWVEGLLLLIWKS